MERKSVFISYEKGSRERVVECVTLLSNIPGLKVHWDQDLIAGEHPNWKRQVDRWQSQAIATILFCGPEHMASQASNWEQGNGVAYAFSTGHALLPVRDGVVPKTHLMYPLTAVRKYGDDLKPLTKMNRSEFESFKEGLSETVERTMRLPMIPVAKCALEEKVQALEHHPKVWEIVERYGVDSLHVGRQIETAICKSNMFEHFDFDGHVTPAILEGMLSQAEDLLKRGGDQLGMMF